MNADSDIQLDYEESEVFFMYHMLMGTYYRFIWK